MNDNYIRKKALNYYYPDDNNELSNIVTWNQIEKFFNEIHDKEDAIIFLSTIINQNNKSLENHNKTCRDQDNCYEKKSSADTNYLLSQKLLRLGISLDKNTFTIAEQEQLENKINSLLERIDELLANNQTLKNGHEILFNELQELKDLFFLGKKNWQQLAAGKFSEMIASGVISETIGHSITMAIKPITNLILE